MRVVGTYLAKFLEDLNGIGKRVKKDLFDFAPVAEEMAKMLVTSNVEGYT
jgi:hypothetical protein